MIVSGMAAWKGQPLIGVGNAIGSNITNIGLVLAVTAIIHPLQLQSNTIKRELPILFIAMGIAWLIISPGYLGYINASLLLIAMMAILFLMFRFSNNSQENINHPDIINNELATEKNLNQNNGMSNWQALFWLLMGFVLLIISSKLLIHGAINIAYLFGMSKLVAGLTIVAIGTSLPELAASVACALKKHDDLAIGNIIGSNIFNSLGVLAIPGLIHPTQLPSYLLSRDFPIMFGFSLLLTLTLLRRKNRGLISRPKGIVLLILYISYQIYLCL